MALALALAACVSGSAVIAGAGVRGRQDDPYEKLKSYDFQSREAVAAVLGLIQQAQTDKKQTTEIEDRLVGVLEDPRSTLAAKEETCRMLWIIGSARSVPTLAKMVVTPELSDIARYALERNVDPAAGKALREAVGKTTGKTQIGIINSLGDRGEADAVGTLQPFTRNPDPLVSEAAITALGKVGTDGALAVLRTLPADNTVVGHAMLRCADRFAAAGKRPAAERLYLSLANAKQPIMVQAEALRGLAVLKSPRAAGVALADLKSPDAGLQQVAARVGASLTDPQVTGRFVAAWPGLPVPTQIVLLTGLADRREAAATPIALRAIESQDAGLRQVGIQSAALVGGGKVVPRLVDLAVKGQGGDRNTARASLARMPGEEAEKAILEAARQGTPEERAALMGVLADRPTPTALAVLLDAANGSDDRVAVEAVRALGRVGGPQEQGTLVNLLVGTQSDAVRDAAREAIVAIGQRDGDRSRAAEPALAALPTAPTPGKIALLSVLAETGGDRALAALTAATNSDNADIKQAAVTGLADTWGDSRPLPLLMILAKSDPNKAIRVQAMRGSLRLIGQDDHTSPEDRVNHIADALMVAERPEEKKQALSILRNCRVASAVELTAPQKRDNRDEPAVTGAATTAALNRVIQLTKDDNQRALAQKLKG
jgi:HEAT repeat protein